MTYPLAKHNEDEVKDGQVSTILSGDVSIPLGCSKCQQETEYRLDTLKTTPVLRCRHCGYAHPFGRAELEVIQRVLSHHGYHFTTGGK